MARPKRLGPYAPLSANYYADDAMLEAGERAELAAVDGLVHREHDDPEGGVGPERLEHRTQGARRHYERLRLEVHVAAAQEFLDEGMVGTALDLTPTILIFAPVMLPIAVKAGIKSSHPEQLAA